MRLLALGLIAVLLFAGCARRAPRAPLKPDPAHAAMLMQIDAFLPKAEAEAAQCRAWPDRRMLDAYVRGLRLLRLSPAGGADMATATMRWFAETYAHCRQRMGAAEGEAQSLEKR